MGGRVGGGGGGGDKGGGGVQLSAARTLVCTHEHARLCVSDTPFDRGYACNLPTPVQCRYQPLRKRSSKEKRGWVGCEGEGGVGLRLRCKVPLKQRRVNDRLTN